MPPDLTAPAGRVPVRAAVPLRAGLLPRRTEPELEGDSSGCTRYRCFFPVGRGATTAAEQARASCDGGRGRARGRPWPRHRRPTAARSDGARCCNGCRLDLVKNFTVTAGAVLQRKVGQVRAVADVCFAIRAGPDVRPRRGVRLRQDDGRTADRRPGEAERRLDRARRARTWRRCSSGSERRQAQPQGAADVPGLLRLDGPADAGRDRSCASRWSSSARAAAQDQRDEIAAMLDEVGPARGPRSTATRTSSPAASGSASAWRGR